MDDVLAGMAKLADAHASEACSRKGLEVQILFPAQIRPFRYFGELAEWPNARDC